MPNWGLLLLRKSQHNKLISFFKREQALFSFLFLLVFILVGYPGIAHVETSLDQRLLYLEQENKSLVGAIDNENNRLVPDANIPIADEKKQLFAQIKLIEAKIATLEQFLSNEQQNQQSVLRELKKAQRSMLGNVKQETLQTQIAFIEKKGDLNEQVITLIIADLKLAHDYQRILESRYQTFLVRQAALYESEQITAEKKKILALEEKRALLYQANIERYQAGNESGPEDGANIFVTDQQILLINNDILHEQLKIKRIKADFSFSESQDIKMIESVTKTYQQMIKEVAEIEQKLKQMLSLVSTQSEYLSNASTRPAFLDLEKQIRNKMNTLKKDSIALAQALEQKQQALKKQLSSRQTLSNYHMGVWPEIAAEIMQIPSQFYLYLKSLVTKVFEYSRWHGGVFSFVMGGALLLIAITAISLYIFLQRMNQNKARSRLSAHLFDGVLVIVQQNIIQVTLIAMGVTLLILNQVAYSTYQLIFHLILIWMIYRQLVLIARLTLLERLDDFSGHDVALYYRLKWLLLTGAWSTALMVMSYELPLSYVLQEIFNWLFMLFLFVLSLVLWKSRDAITYVLPPPWRNRRGYVRHVVSLIGVLLPITLLTTALIGFVGYINLAWTMSRYQAYGLLFIAGYVLIRGLLRDALDLISEWMVAVLYNGWLWVEVFLKPVDKLFRAALFVGAVYLLGLCLGFSSDPKFMAWLIKMLHYPLINVSGVHITFMSLGEFFALLFLFVWMAKWTRECCYRWVYRDVVDLGIRNSLSVFTQYAVILLGFFITVRVLGVDFTGMAVVLGGLAVGMGFGLRDFASNIVGGLMLLIERPVREGDLITIGDYEGKVAHIGIRSMRVSSWDNMEVLIPNAETFNKPFSNWTHQDSVVRTVIPIKVSRSDDPLMIQQLIFDVLEIIPEVLDEPASQVFLKKIDDTLIEFEVRYFINVRLYTRFEIRSKVLFAIMAQFKAAGVKSPVPALHVELDAGVQNSGLSDAS